MNYLEDLELAYQLGDQNPEVIPILQRVIAAADVYQDIEVGVEARDLMIEATVYNGQMKKALQAFAWLIKKYEEKSPFVSTYDILWKYKWIAGDTCGILAISKEQIENLLVDMKTKFQENGFSLRPYYKTVAIAAEEMGDAETAADYFEKWQATPADYMNDCVACETNDVAHHHYFTGDSQKAIQAAQPVINGKQSCAEIPHLTYGFAALAFLDIDQPDQAAACFSKGYPLVRQEPEYLKTIGQFVSYQYQIGDLVKAKEIITENEAILERSDSEMSKMLFMIHALPVVQADSSFPKISRDLAARFDARNGNDYYSKLWQTSMDKRERDLEI